MLVIYHFYDWTWSFCYRAYSNTFLSSLSSLYLLFNCITIVNLLHYRIVLFFILPLLPFCCRIASEWPERSLKSKYLSERCDRCSKTFVWKKNLSRCSSVGMIKIFKHKSLFTKTQFAKGLKIREMSWKKKFLAVTSVHEEDWEMWLKNKNFYKKTN